MATPSRSNAVSTPKNNMTGTPTRVMASPRPGFAGAGGRSFAGKSPAVKTPASLQGHSHNLSSSSHPSSTPIPAPTPNLGEDLLALNSPAAALMASLSGHGLTPGPSGQDGLGISTLHSGGVHADATSARNLEAERSSRLREVTETLKTRLAGPGITREGVERLAQLNGFALLPDEDNVTIAGNHCVDLEITFDHFNRDSVRNVVLKINTSGEEEHKTVASDILKNDLMQSLNKADGAPWKGLEDFTENLGYLSQLDHLSSKVNCFAAIAGVYDSFQAIWEEEKKRHTWRSELHHLSRGISGKASMDRGRKLGLSVEYWAEKQRLQEQSTSKLAVPERVSPTMFIAKICCESGSPSITKFRNWLGPEVFRNEAVSNNLQDEPAWRDPGIDGASNNKDDQDAMMENLETLLEPSNVRFVSYLTPSVLLPLQTILGLNAQATMIEVDQNKFITYLDQLQKSAEMHSEDTGTGQLPQFRRQLTVFDKEGQMIKHSQEYSLFAVAPVWCCAVEKLMFSHPRRFLEALPILRQYGLLWSLLEKLVSRKGSDEKETKPVDTKPPEKKAGLRTRSNRPITLRSKARQAATNESISHGNQPKRSELLSVSISLDVVTDPAKPTIHMFLPFIKKAGMVKVSVAVGLNGELDVYSTSNDSSMDKIGDKITKILALSEDLGVLLEWILEEAREMEM